jgi:hypothetical protein
MAYGDIRAVVQSTRTRYCMRCAQDLFFMDKLKCVELRHPRATLPRDVDGDVLLRECLRYGYARSLRGVLCEGMKDDQAKLDRLKCSRCAKRLRLDCTDY